MPEFHEILIVLKEKDNRLHEELFLLGKKAMKKNNNNKKSYLGLWYCVKTSFISSAPNGKLAQCCTHQNSLHTGLSLLISKLLGVHID